MYFFPGESHKILPDRSIKVFPERTNKNAAKWYIQINSSLLSFLLGVVLILNARMQY
jgi:hypothetical protein